MNFRATTNEQSGIYRGLAVGIASGMSATTSAASLSFLMKELNRSRVRTMEANIINDDGTVSIEQRNQFYIKDMMGNIVSVMATLARLYFPMAYLNSSVPAAVIAGIPLGTVSALSHAMSANDLKFRSKGGIFLAHQEGGEQTLRIEGKAFGPNRFIMLIMLDALFRYGSSIVVDTFEAHIKFNGGTRYEYVPNSTSADPWEPLNKFALNEGKVELHKTFPIITLQRVYTSMYIETWTFTESIINGLDCINYTLFFRKFRALPPEQYGAILNENVEIVYYYKKDTNEELYRKLNRLDFSLEFALSAALLSFRTFMILSGNSLEKNVAMTTALSVHESVTGVSSFSEVLMERVSGLTSEDSLNGYSIENKEELMQIG